MGNYAFISFRRRVTDDQFYHMLKVVVDENYGDYYEVIYQPGEKKNPDDPGSPNTGWTIQPKDGILGEDEGSIWRYSLFIARYSNYTTGKLYGGKFYHKHMRAGEWGYWFMGQIHGHLCQRFKAILSDEGVPGSWKQDPAETPTVQDYIDKHMPSIKEHPELYRHITEGGPEKLMEIRG